MTYASEQYAADGWVRAGPGVHGNARAGGGRQERAERRQRATGGVRGNGRGGLRSVSFRGGRGGGPRGCGSSTRNARTRAHPGDHSRRRRRRRGRHTKDDQTVCGGCCAVRVRTVGRRLQRGHTAVIHHIAV